MKIVGVVLAVVLIVVGAAGAAAFLLLRGSDEVILDKVPADADVVVTAYLDPAASQKVNLLRIASKFPDLGDPAHIRDQLNTALDQLLADVGMNHDDLSWVGPEVGFYLEVHSVDHSSYAVLIAANDPDAAEAFLEKYRQGSEQRQGVTYATVDHDGVQVEVPSSGLSGAPAFALVDGVVVLGGDEEAVDAAIDTTHGGSTIQDDPGFQRVVGALPEAKLGVAFVDAAHLADTFGDQLAAAGVTTGTTNLSALDGVGVSLSAQPNGLALDTVMMYDDTKLTDAQRATLSAEDHPNPLLDMIPGDALGMYAVEHLDSSIQDSIDQITRTTPGADRQLQALGVTGPGGLLSQLTGDVAVEGTAQSGSVPAGGALLLATNDPNATQHWLDQTLQEIPLGGSRVVRKPNGALTVVPAKTTWSTEEHAGVTITYAPVEPGVELSYAVVGNVAVIASSRAQLEAVVDTKASGSSISSDPGFTAATQNVPTSDGVLYLDVPAIVATVRQQLPPQVRADFDDRAGKDLAPIEAVVAGSENSQDEQRIRVLVRVP